MHGSLRHAVAVWNGPDVRRRAGSFGLIDFGICGWFPLVHLVANRSLNASLIDASRLAPFLAAVERHLPLTDAEHEHLPLFRALNAAVYARWVAIERVSRKDAAFNATWFDQLVGMLRKALPDQAATEGGSPLDPGKI